MGVVGWRANSEARSVAAFLDEIELVRIYVAEGLLRAARPLDLDAFSASGFAQAEIGAQVAL